MNSSKTDVDLILLNGPPFVGIKQFYEEHLSKTHTCLIPSEIFSQGDSIGLRDIGLKIVQQVQKGQKVAVLDGNEVRKTRESYIKLLKKKCSNSKIMVINIFPKYGCHQLFWSRELAFATTGQCDTKMVSMADKHILKWFEKETDTDISYRFGQVDAVIESEGCCVHTVKNGLSAKSVYKWEVPCLLIQWEIMSKELESDRGFDSIVEIVKYWMSNNPCGRIIMICDGNKIKTGEETKYQEIADIKSAIKSLCDQLDECVVYVYHIEDPDQAGWFVQPPRPGILAYSQKRHNLNLHSRNTCYLYQSGEHMKMAENAGVRHIKGTKVLRNPNLIKSQTAMTVPAVPEMLMCIELVPQHTGSGQGPCIPMFDMKKQFQDGMITNVIGRGRTEYVFAKALSKINEMQDLYEEMASKVGEEGSKMSPEKTNQSGGFIPFTAEMNQSKTSYVSRDLPKWMLGKTGSGSKSLKSSAEPSGDVEIDDSSKKKTIYMMTDHELVETAIDILKQAGKTDLVNNFKSRQEIMSSGKRDNKTQPRRSPDTNNSRRQRKRLSEESLSSFCPKMEPDSEVDDGGIKNDMGSNRVAKESKRQRSSVQTGHNCSSKRPCESEIVNIEKELESFDESEDSVECPSSEPSQGEGDSLDLESDVEDLANIHEVPEEKMEISETNIREMEDRMHESVLWTDHSDSEGVNGKRLKNSNKNSNVETARTKGSKSTAKVSSLKDNGERKENVYPKRYQHKPDLSILDEIFD